tara:strand:- start:18244 stop:19245 length:1002 start_codon:yes stop_codon:yes gene_type:complete
MNIGFICNISNSYGSGHFHRCLALSQIFKKGKLFFFGNKFPKSLKLKKNYKFINLKKKNYIKLLLEKLKINNIKILVLDDYNITYKEQKILRDNVDKLIVIDDYVSKIHNCDIIINYNNLNLTQIKKIKSKNKGSKFAIGKKFLILNKDFIKEKNNAKKRIKIKNVLIFFGSSDHTMETDKIFKLVNSFKNLNFNLVLSSYNKNLVKLKKKYQRLRNIKIHTDLNSKKFAKLIIKNDLSIGAGGVNLNERLYLGLPNIVVETSDNQSLNIDYLIKKKIIFYLGKSKNLNNEKYKRQFNEIMNSKKIFRDISNKSFDFYKNYSTKHLSNLFNIK